NVATGHVWVVVLSNPFTTPAAWKSIESEPADTPAPVRPLVTASLSQFTPADPLPGAVLTCTTSLPPELNTADPADRVPIRPGSPGLTIPVTVTCPVTV